MKTTNKGVKIAVASIVATVASAIPVSAVGEVQTQQVTQGINSFRDILSNFGEPICVIVMVVAGIAMMGGQQGRQWAKPTMLFAAIGYAIVKFAPMIVELLSTSFA